MVNFHIFDPLLFLCPQSVWMQYNRETVPSPDWRNEF